MCGARLRGHLEDLQQRTAGAQRQYRYLDVHQYGTGRERRVGELFDDSAG